MTLRWLFRFALFRVILREIRLHIILWEVGKRNLARRLAVFHWFHFARERLHVRAQRRFRSSLQVRSYGRLQEPEEHTKGHRADR